MPLPIISNVDRVVLHWTESTTGLEALNVMHVREVTPLASSVVASRFLTHCTAAMWSWMSSTCRVTQIDVTPLDGASATYSASVAASANTTGGSGSSTPLPQVAGLIKLTTALRGRSFRGRVYIPNVAENEITGRTLSDVAAVQAAWTAFLAAMTADDLNIVVASYLLAEANTVTSALAESMSATQRRRVGR